MDEEALLRYVEENGMIDPNHIQELIEKKQQEYLKLHPYKIWYCTDGWWYTYLPDMTKKSKRRLVKRKTEEKVKHAVVEYWKGEDINPKVAVIYREWVGKKLARGEITKSTKSRYDRVFESYFKSFRNKRIKSIDEIDIEDFLLDTIHEYELSQKAYSGLKTLVLGIFKYAKKKKYVKFSISAIIQDMELSKKAFKKNLKTDEELVFMEDELERITEYLAANADILNLGLLLLFKTGLRIGELVALKWCDIDADVIHISRTEIRYKDEETGKYVYEIQDYPKTEAGIRDVILPTKYLWIIKKIRFKNPFGEYIFERDKCRIRTYIFRTRLYTACRWNDIVPKSPHKIRKTYASILVDSGVSEALIIAQMGHTNIETTKAYYYRNRKSLEGKKIVINKVTNL